MPVGVFTVNLPVAESLGVAADARGVEVEEVETGWGTAKPIGLPSGAARGVFAVECMPPELPEPVSAWKRGVWPACFIRGLADTPAEAGL
eukprot:5534702-Pleurochrysis_carterae.AAC.2